MTYDITPVVAAGRQLIDAYGDGGFVVAGERYQGSLLVFQERSLSWEVSDRKQINLENLSAVIEASDQSNILLVGCGLNFEAEPSGLRQGLKAHGIVLEWMDTGAACRTYNVLLSEDRRAMAALIAVD